MNNWHAFFGISIVVLNVYATIDLIILNGLTWGLNVGFVIAFLFFALTGAIAYVFKRKLSWNTKAIIWIRYIHRVLAFIFWGTSLLVMTMGIHNFIRNKIDELPSMGYLVPLNVAAMICITFALEAYY